jgi:hypothetical protein
MYNVSWVNENGKNKDYECRTSAERDAKIEEITSQGMVATWEEVHADAAAAY